MESVKFSKRWLILINATLMIVFSAVLYIQFHQSSLLNNTLQYQEDNVSWDFFQLEAESLRFRGFLQDALAKPDDVDVDLLQLRLDIFFSRFDVVAQGKGAALLKDYKDFAPTIAQVRAFFDSVDPYFKQNAVARLDANALRKTLQAMDLLREPLHNLSLAAIDMSGTRTEHRADEVRRQIAISSALILFQCALSLLFFIIVVRQIRQVEAGQSRLFNMATKDALTGLPNRTLLQEHLQHALLQAHRNNGGVAVLFIDLDRFNVINDTLGHDVGDLLLKDVAARLVSSVRSEDLVARQGGDEFIVLLSNVVNAQYAGTVAQKILNALLLPFQINGQKLHISASIGIAICPDDGEDMGTLLKHSDTAMYHAKNSDRNNYQFFTPQMNALAAERQSMGNDLRHALGNNELFLNFQPVIDMTSGKLAGMEVLLRWQHPLQGLISPLKFIPLAEEIGLIVPIGEWVLRTACMQLKAWQNQGYEVPRMAINLSARQFRQHTLAATIARILHETGVEACFIGLEITESMLVENVDEVIDTLHTLNTMGLEVSIDDFGTGYSSLSYLKRYPIDTLKIDRSFVQDIATDPDDATIVTAIIAMAHSLQMNVIAEGVETEEQLAFLRQRGCDRCQGYYFSKPLPASGMVSKLSRPGAGVSRAVRVQEIEQM